MRDAAQRGAFQLVAQRRIEFDQMPARLWAAGYKAVHSELVAAKADPPGRRLRETQCLEEQAAMLAQEVRKRRVQNDRFDQKASLVPQWEAEQESAPRRVRSGAATA